MNTRVRDFNQAIISPIWITADTGRDVLDGVVATLHLAPAETEFLDSQL
jgi:hypothetical protein